MFCLNIGDIYFFIIGIEIKNDMHVEKVYYFNNLYAK